MSGFLDLRIRPVVRRLLTRVTAILPALITVLALGEQGLNQLLVLSQVVLCVQLPFAVFPLVYFTTSRHVMGKFASRPSWKSIFSYRRPRICEQPEEGNGGQLFANGWIMTGLATLSAILVSVLTAWLAVKSVQEAIEEK
jgi:Mn2+/Fe2+ NRAMP family transporter